MAEKEIKALEAELKEFRKYVNTIQNDVQELFEDYHRRMKAALASHPLPEPEPLPTLSQGSDKGRQRRSTGSVQLDMESYRQLAAQAQYLALRDADELGQIVIHAFLELCETEEFITFPLMLEQVVPANHQ